MLRGLPGQLHRLPRPSVGGLPRAPSGGASSRSTLALFFGNTRFRVRVDVQRECSCLTYRLPRLAKSVNFAFNFGLISTDISPQKSQKRHKGHKTTLDMWISRSVKLDLGLVS